MKFKYIIPVLAAVAAVSCQKADQEFDSNLDPNAVRIEATVGGGIFTRSNPLEEGAASTVFKTGDVVMVAAEAQGAVGYTFNGTTWSAETGKYLRWDTPTMTFKAWYPQTASMTDFILPIDQRTTAKIESADYMTYSGDHTRDGATPISLTLQRKTARVILKIAAFGDEYAENERTVSNVKIASGASGYSAGVVSGDVVIVTSYANSMNDTFTGLVIPTAAKPTKDFLDLYDGKGYRLFAKGIPAMEAGKSYTYNVKVGKEKLELEDVTVADWNTGDVIPGGEAAKGKAQIGFCYFEDGTYGSDPSAGKPIGIVFYVNPDGKSGKIVSLDQATGTPWSTENIHTGATSETDGAANTAKVLALDSYIADNTKYPPFAWCAAKNLTAPAGISWYIPAQEELKALYGTDGATKSAVNKSLALVDGAIALSTYYYWSSTESNNNDARGVIFLSGSDTGSVKRDNDINLSVRFVSAF